MDLMESIWFHKMRVRPKDDYRVVGILHIRDGYKLIVVLKYLLYPLVWRIGFPLRGVCCTQEEKAPSMEAWQLETEKPVFRFHFLGNRRSIFRMCQFCMYDQTFPFAEMLCLLKLVFQRRSILLCRFLYEASLPCLVHSRFFFYIFTLSFS